MSDNQWIIVRNWAKFQSDRTTRWIKLYLDLIHNDEWMDLTDGARGLQVRIWVLYASCGGVLGMKQVRRQGWTRHSPGHLASLVQAGFIQISDTKPRPRLDKKDKKEGNDGFQPSKPRPQSTDNGRIPCPVCGANLQGPLALAEHGYRQHAGPYPDHWDDGWDDG